MTSIKVGIIGGSGFYDMPELRNRKEVKGNQTEFGSPSSDPVEGTIEGVPCVVLARHGRRHQFSPADVNYRANMLALKDLGVTHVLAATACGSLREELPPGHFVILDSFIDRTTKRTQTFHTQEATSGRFGKVAHIPMSPSFCPKTCQVVFQAARALLEDKVSPTGTVVTIEGPRFSSKAESRLFRSWGVDVVNMTTVPEVVLAKELGLSYCSVAMVTDYDCWRDGQESVDVSKVMAVLNDNVGTVRKLIVEAIKLMAGHDWKETIKENEVVAAGSVLTR